MNLSKFLAVLTSSLLLAGSSAFAQTTEEPPLNADPTVTQPAPVTPPANGSSGKKSAAREANVNAHEANQEARIEQGVKSGELNAKEAANLEKRQEKIKADEAKAMADGKMTKKEAAKIRHEQHRASQKIHSKKHNRRKG